ncbi:hypothetical protein ACQP3L_32995, partial [Escherichia coli]
RRGTVDLPHRSAILGAAHSSCVLATYLYGDHKDLPQARKKANENPCASLSKLRSLPVKDWSQSMSLPDSACYSVRFSFFPSYSCEEAMQGF